MPYGTDDPAKDLRISRLSLISSAANLYAQDTEPDPEKVLAAARLWETWVYKDTAAPVVNGTTAPTPISMQAGGPVCAECGNPVDGVRFKDGKVWSPDLLVQKSTEKYGRVLCKSHYFSKKP